MNLALFDFDSAADRATLDAAHRRWYRWREETVAASA